MSDLPDLGRATCREWADLAVAVSQQGADALGFALLLAVLVLLLALVLAVLWLDGRAARRARGGCGEPR